MTERKQNANCAAEERSPGTADQEALALLVCTVFAAWHAQNIDFLVLRNYEGLPARTGNDIDVLVSPAQIHEAEQALVRAAGTAGYLLHNRVEFATVSFFFYNPETLHQIRFDLFTRIAWHSFEIFAAEPILNRSELRDCFSIPIPADEAAINLLTRLLYTGRVHDEYKSGIARSFNAEGGMAVDLLEPLFGRKDAAAVVSLAAEERWGEIEREAVRLRRKLISRRCLLHPLRTFGSLIADSLRAARRLMQPGGLILVLLGPDGSGKSTIAACVEDQLKNTFNPARNRKVHWKPTLRGRNKPPKPVVDPHGRPPRNRLLSVAYLLFHWAEFFVGSHLLFRKTTFNNGLVLVDRYYYDFLVDQRRYRLKVPSTLIKILFKLIRQPDLVVLLDAPAEVLHARKQEVPMEESRRQVAAFREVVGQLANGRVANASLPPDQVADALMREILGWMHERAARRVQGSSTAR